MKKLALFGFAFFGLSAFSQNYDLVKPNKVNYFLDFKDFVHELRIDSTFINGSETEFYSFDRIRKVDTCYVAHSASIFGQAMLKNNNEWKIVNTEQDTITIKTDAQTNDTWVCFGNLENQYIEAKCISVSQENILGSILDSVKTINFTLKDSTTNATISNDINTLVLKISKNNGIVKMLDFARFPFVEINTSYYKRFNYKEVFSNSQLILESIEDAVVLRKEYKMSYYYNFEIGDVFQTKVSEEYGVFGTANGGGATSYCRKYMLYEVLDKQFNTGFTSYTLSFKSREYCADYGNQGNSEIFDSGLINISVNNDSLIFEGVLFENDLDSFQYLPSVVLKKSVRDELYFTKFYLNPAYNYLGAINSCSISSSTDYYYIQGVFGHFYFSKGYVTSDNFESKKKELIYYKNSTTEWGERVGVEPIIPEEPKEQESLNDVYIYPNPNNGSFTIFMKDYFDVIRVIITDASGREYYNERAYNEEAVIDLDLADGVYYLSINNGTMKDRKKFVVKN